MKKIMVLTLLLSLLACSSASAIDITAETTGATRDGVIYSLYLDGKDEEFDAVDLSIVGDGVEFLDILQGWDGFIPPGPGYPSTFISLFLRGPTFAGGQGWTLLNSDATTAEVRIAGGPLGAKIDTSAPIFLANVILPVGERGIYTGKFVNEGNTISEVTGFWPIPEPSSLLLLGLGLISLAGTRRCTQRPEA